MKIKWGYVILGIGALTLIVGGIVYRKNIVSGLKGIVDYAFTTEQEHYLSQLHPDYQNTFRRFIADVEKNLGYKVLITSGYRTFAEQDAEHKSNPQNAVAGKSLHNFGLAADINLISKSDGTIIKKADSTSTWTNTGVVDTAKKYGLKWGGGGNFGSYLDNVHFEVPLNASTLYAQGIKQFGSEANVIGNQVNIA